MKTDATTMRGMLAGAYPQPASALPQRVAAATGDITGTPGDDFIDGSEGDDEIFTGDGSDTVFAAAGDDLIELGRDADVVVAGDGNDTVRGGAGDDSGSYYDPALDITWTGLYGGEGDDLIDGGSGDDILRGGAGADTLLGGTGDDRLDDSDFAEGSAGLLNGGGGNDTIVADSGDRVAGGDGDDEIGYRYGQASIDGGNGDDSIELYLLGAGSTVLGGDGADWLHGSGHDGGATLLDGGSGDDRIEYSEGVAAGGAQSTIRGGEGDDTLQLGSGSYRVDAGGGNDLIVLRATFSEGPSRLTTGSGSDTLRLEVDPAAFGQPLLVTDFQAGVGGDRLDLADWLADLDGNYRGTDPFQTGWMRAVADGDDTLLQVDLDGTAGSAGWTSTVRLRGVDPSSLVAENFVGDVSPFADTAPRYLVGGRGDDTLTGASGDDGLSGLDGNDFLDGGFAGNDRLEAGAGDDSLFGFSGDDELRGGAGADVASGGTGNDVLRGGDGDDAAFFNSVVRGVHVSGDGLMGNEGDDLIDGGAGNDALAGGLGRDTLLGGTGDDRLLDGGSFETDFDADQLFGGAGNDYLQGNSGDSLYGGSGDDRLTGRVAGGLFDGGTGNDTLVVEAGGEGGIVRGGAGKDDLQTSGLTHARIEGGAGSDTISVGYFLAYDDTVDAGTGNDVIAMDGRGHQVFAGDGDDRIEMSSYIASGDRTFTVATGAGSDVVAPGLGSTDSVRNEITVSDFSTGSDGDLIDLADINAALGLAADADAFASGHVRLTATGADSLLEVDRSGPGDGAHFVTVLTLQGVLPSQVAAANFVQQVTPVSSANPQAPTLEEDKTVDVVQGGSAALQIARPGDPDGGRLVITVEKTPNLGYVTLRDGSTVGEGQVLTMSQLLGLRYDSFGGSDVGPAGLFRYSVRDNEGSAVMRDVKIELAPLSPEASLAITVAPLDDVGMAAFMAHAAMVAGGEAEYLLC